MPDQKCSNCGRDLPSELGQHSIAPMSGLVTCPHCGAEVTLQKEETVAKPESGAGDKARGADFQAPSSGVGNGEGKQDDGDVFTGDESTETFSGSETMEGVKEELEQKPETTGT